MKFIRAVWNWFIAVVFVHGWWRKHPSEWVEIKKTKGKLTQKYVHYDALPEMYAKRGKPIHKITCKVCGEEWFTSCKKHLCRNITCWIKYYAHPN